MNAREGVDMVKMAIACLLLTLLIGATLGVWYYMSSSAYQAQSQMEKSVDTAKADNLFDLTQYTRDEGLVAVPTVVSAITEFDDGDLLFIRVVALDKDGNPYIDEIYVPQGLNDSGSFTASGQSSVGIIYDDVVRYVNAACKRLLQFSDSYCQIVAEEIESPNHGISITSDNDKTMMGISVFIY